MSKTHVDLTSAYIILESNSSRFAISLHQTLKLLGHLLVHSLVWHLVFGHLGILTSFSFIICWNNHQFAGPTPIEFPQNTQTHTPVPPPRGRLSSYYFWIHVQLWDNLSSAPAPILGIGYGALQAVIYFHISKLKQSNICEFDRRYEQSCMHRIWHSGVWHSYIYHLDMHVHIININTTRNFMDTHTCHEKPSEVAQCL